jgi:phosphomannomutase
MIDKRIVFGTDGWCGVMGDDFTEENVARVAKAFVHYLTQKNPRQLKVAVGFDGRKDSGEFAGLFSRILSKNSVRVLVSSAVVPTPVLSFAVKHHDCAAGVMITAGHNPPQYNGLKFKGAYGGPFTTAETKKIELLVAVSDAGPAETSSRKSDLISVIDFLPAYLSHLETIVDYSVLKAFADNPQSIASVLIDSMGGVGQSILEDILVGCRWRAQTLFGEAEPNFFDRFPESISRNLQPLQYNVSVTDTQFGIATDGDAGRCGIVCDNGELLSPQETILALLWHLFEQKGWRGGIVKTASVTDKVRILAEEWKVPLFDVQVGFNHVTETMVNERCSFGAEEGGGFGYGNHVPERDALLSALLFTEIVAVSGKSLRTFVQRIRDRVGTSYCGRIDIGRERARDDDLLAKFLNSPPKQLSDFAIKNILEYRELGALTGVKLECGDSRWLLIRTSQIGPMVHLHAEGQTKEDLVSLLSEGRRMIDR